MQINGKVKGDFVANIRNQQEGNWRECVAVLKTKVKKDSCAAIWGDEFLNVAFANLRETEDGPSWACKFLSKPALICEVMQVEINGQTLEVQPEIPKLMSVEGEAAVLVPLKMRFDLRTEKIAGKIAFAVGTNVEFTFDAKQLPVPGSNANAPAGVVRIRKGNHGNPEPVRA